jgi:predicted DNA-binding transcriptional regulator AlpA
MQVKDPIRRYVRLAQLVGNRNATPPIPGILPVSAATIWRAIRRGDMPAPIKLGPRTTVWDLAAIERWLESKRRPGAR